MDGELQSFKAKGGAYIRKEFFGKYPELLALVEHMSDDELHRLTRGGHDPQKVYNAYLRAVQHTGSPTVILAQTVKGYGLGLSGSAQRNSLGKEAGGPGAVSISHALRHSDTGVGSARWIALPAGG